MNGNLPIKRNDIHSNIDNFFLNNQSNKKGGNITNQDTINDITQEISIYKNCIILIYERGNINIDILIEGNILPLNGVSMGYYKERGLYSL